MKTRPGCETRAGAMPERPLPKEAEPLSQGWAGTYSSDPFARTVLGFRLRPFRAFSFPVLVPCAAAKAPKVVSSVSWMERMRGLLATGSLEDEEGVEGSGVFAIAAEDSWAGSLVGAAAG